MAQGKWKRVLLGIQGLVGHRKAPDWGFIYEVSGNKAAGWEIGDHVVLPDGREFVYSKSSGICSTAIAVQFAFTGVQTYDTVVNAQAIGDRVITVDGGTHNALVKDELRGGYVITWPAANKDQFRGIIGNDAADADADFKIYLDGPLTVVLTVGDGVEVFQNPYGSLIGSVAGGGSANRAKAGVPAAYVSATGKYFWVQIRGPVFVAPASDVITNKLGAYFRHNGSIEAGRAFGDVGGNNTTQYAGHRIIGDYANVGPLFMLQG